jgi:CBS domain-containing protein
LGIKAKDIMTRDVITVRRDMKVNELVDLFVEHKISSVPVLDIKGALVGIVTKTDIIGHCMDMDLDLTVTLGLKDIMDSHPGLENLTVTSETQLKVEDIMTPHPVIARENHTVEKLAEIMLEHRVHRLIIVKGKKLTGIVSTFDIISFVAGKIKQ